MKKVVSNSGFTLIELLVVIAIIGVLSSVVLASLSSSRSKARDARRKEDMIHLRTAIEAYFADHGSYPVSAGGYYVGYGNTTCGTPQGTLSGASGYVPNLAPQYIAVLPVDPGGSTANCTGYQYDSDGKGYAILNHAVPESYPTSGQQFYDPLRPTWAWKLCNTPISCTW